MRTSMSTLTYEMEVVFGKFMELSNPGTVKESNDEFKERKIECMQATSRVMQGRLAGDK